jgi:Ca-activated chloride channel homolog
MRASKREFLSRCIAAPATYLTGNLALAGPLQEAEDFQIRVNVDLIVLYVTVRDKAGGVVLDLKRENFHIYEDGVLQDLQVFRYEDSPVTIGLVVDHSGSMRRMLEEVAVAAKTFVQLSSPQDEMFVVNFNEKVSLGLPTDLKMTNQANELSRAITRAPADGMTALYDAVLKGLELLSSGSREKKALVVVSDGGDTASVHNVGEMMSMVERSTALIYTLGIFDDNDPDRRPQVLRRLARISGGEAFFPKHPRAIVAACERVAHEIRHQYTLAYVSKNNRKPGSYRGIRVSVDSVGDSHLIARTRSGYISSGASLGGKTPVGR